MNFNTLISGLAVSLSMMSFSLSAAEIPVHLAGTPIGDESPLISMGGDLRWIPTHACWYIFPSTVSLDQATQEDFMAQVCHSEALSPHAAKPADVHLAIDAFEQELLEDIAAFFSADDLEEADIEERIARLEDKMAEAADVLDLDLPSWLGDIFSRLGRVLGSFREHTLELIQAQRDSFQQEVIQAGALARMAVDSRMKWPNRFTHLDEVPEQNLLALVMLTEAVQRAAQSDWQCALEGHLPPLFNHCTAEGLPEGTDALSKVSQAQEQLKQDPMKWIAILKLQRELD